MFTVVLTICTLGLATPDAACRAEVTPADSAPTEMACIYSTAHAIADDFPALIDDNGMLDGREGHTSERVRLKSFRCERT